jgi:hypothetical protein
MGNTVRPIPLSQSQQATGPQPLATMNFGNYSPRIIGLTIAASFINLQRSVVEEILGDKRVLLSHKIRGYTSEIKVGDVVLMRQSKTNKLSTPFNPHPYKVVTRKGSMLHVVVKLHASFVFQKDWNDEHQSQKMKRTTKPTTQSHVPNITKNKLLYPHYREDPSGKDNPPTD